jgi:prolyl-tRNA editing enzyme YbaK/EbsC (Cys-tRNA(Pro) deacylase)
MLADSLRRYLDAQNAQYRVMPHAESAHARDTARLVDVPYRRFAKSVLVRALSRPPGQLVLAVIPADCNLNLDRLRVHVGFPLEIASEQDTRRFFPGVPPGLLPPIGALAVEHVPVFVDEALGQETDIAFPGSPTDVVLMPWQEYVRIARPTLTPCGRHRIAVL